MSLNDLVKYLTQRMTTYMDTPTEEKHRQRSTKETNPPIYANKWFGILPFVLKLARNKTD